MRAELRWVVALTLSVVAGCESEETTVAPEPVAAAPDDRDPWQRFEDERSSSLAALGEPIVDCVARKDTEHPAFHGCYDWHSAVHGVWALYALARLEGNERWAAAANLQLDYAAIDGVRAQIEAGKLDAELPYGFSWFLLLALERERATGGNDMRAVGAIAARRLRAHIEKLDADAIARGVAADDYENLSWAVLNLWRWAQFTGDVDTQTWSENFVRQNLLSQTGECTLRADSYRTANFFAPCLMRVHAIVEVLPREEGTAWIEGFIGRDAVVEPLTAIEKPHPGGLNFSRAWGLWSMWQSTGDERWRESFRSHVVTHLQMPEYWREGYDDFSHWVPQFGVYALALSMERR